MRAVAAGRRAPAIGSAPDVRATRCRSFAPGVDPGPSFVDLLRKVAPAPAPGRRRVGTAGAAPIEITHGTTVVAIRYAGGVVMAGDRRATAGYTIASRRIEKVFAGRRLLRRRDRRRRRARRSRWCKLFQVQLEHYEKVEGEQLIARGQGQPARASWCGPTCPRRCRASWSCRCSPATTTAARRGRVFSYDVTGGKYEEADYQANGSGGVHARNWIKAGWREGMSRDEAIDLALRALFAAADEDVATGGPDLVRGIFPTVAVDRRRRLPRARRRRRRGPRRGAARRPRARGRGL